LCARTTQTLCGVGIEQERGRKNTLFSCGGRQRAKRASENRGFPRSEIAQRPTGRTARRNRKPPHDEISSCGGFRSCCASRRPTGRGGVAHVFSRKRCVTTINIPPARVFSFVRVGAMCFASNTASQGRGIFERRRENIRDHKTV